MGFLRLISFAVPRHSGFSLWLFDVHEIGETGSTLDWPAGHPMDPNDPRLSLTQLGQGEPLLLYESLRGPEGALRPRSPSQSVSWQPQ